MDKKNKNSNVPNLRFNGYTENWQKYRTIELGKIQRGKSKHRPRDDEKLYGGAYPFIQTGDIKKANLYIKEYERTYSNYGLSQSKLWSKGTLCITIAANIAETAILGLNACFPDSVIGWISNEKITNNIFIKYYFDFYKTQLKRLSVGGAQENLNLDKLENVYFHIPTLPEQNDITNLLTKIDELIETQIKIIEEYVILKNSLIHRFFTMDNPKVKLSTILTEINIKNKNKQIDTVLSVSNKLGFIKQSEQFEDREVASDDTSNYKIVNKGDYAYNPARINVGSIARLINYDKGIISPMYSCFKINEKKITYTYFDMFLSSFSFKRQLNKKLEGSVRQCLTFEGMLSMDIELPCIETQKSISNKIDMLNYKIKLESDYREALIKQKQFLLNNMFI